MESASSSSVTSSHCSGTTTDDSETCSKANDSYLQQGLERLPSSRLKQKVKLVDESDGNDEKNGGGVSDVSDEESTALDDAPGKFKFKKSFILC